jgi:hypothetical protein
VLFIDERYYWYYQNDTNKHFRAKFNFQLTNLEIEEEMGDESNWGVSLPPGDHIVKFFS